jgi:hypothetical protein
MIARRYDEKDMAKWLVDRDVQLDYPCEYLSGIVDYAHSYRKEIGRAMNGSDMGRRHDKCAACGKEIMLDHNGAIYCSRECRQRAYRVRKAKAEGRNSPMPERPRTPTIPLPGGLYELRLKRPGRMKKRSESGQDDASSSAEDKTTVTHV